VSTLLLLRFLKVLSIGALFSGSVGSVMARDFEDRRRFAHWMAGPALLATWGSGLGLAYATGTSLFSTWILAAFALTVVSAQGVLYVAGKEGRRGPIAASVIILPLVGAAALMVWRP
jgi:hypothetical protein